MTSLEQRGWLVRLWHAFNRTFFKGLVAILPLAVTLYALIWLVTAADNLLAPFLKSVLSYKDVQGTDQTYYIPGMGLIASVIMVFSLGLVLNAWIVQQFLSASERMLQRIPLAKTIFRSVRDLRGFFAKSGDNRLHRVVFVEVTPGVRLVGFVTRESAGDIALEAGADLMVVYIPLSYALGGYTLLVPREKVQAANIPMEEAMRFVLTAGMKGPA